MPELVLTARRVGDPESRTEEYELSFAVEDAADVEPRVLRVKYQAARAYEINAALDAATETARETIAGHDPDLAREPTDESLAQFAWRAMQSVKYDAGDAKTSRLTLL